MKWKVLKPRAFPVLLGKKRPDPNILQGSHSFLTLKFQGPDMTLASCMLRGCPVLVMHLWLGN